MTGTAPIGVLLLNLGGPESEEEIAPFLRSMLSDPDVMPLPWPIRPLLAQRIARTRAPVVAGHYRAIGGGSPVVAETRAQVDALSSLLGDDYQVRYAFRHTSPGVHQVVRKFAADRIRRLVAVPAYPQWSRTTTGSALRAFRHFTDLHGIESLEIPAFPDGKGFVQAVAELTREVLRPGDHVVVSAHGLPQRIVDAGDPYVDQVKQTAEAVVSYLPVDTPWSLAFQSRMGRAAWTRPYLNDEIRRLGREGVRSLVVVPVSFACENLETQFELDMQVRELARDSGIESYRRVPAPGTHVLFIDLLATLARQKAIEAGWESPRVV